MTTSTLARRAARKAQHYGEHADPAYWEGILASEGMPDRLPMLDARTLTPAIADAISAHSPVLVDELSTVATVVTTPTVVQVLRDGEGRLTRRVPFTRVDTGMSVSATRGADGRYVRLATLRRLPVDALVTVDTADIVEHDSPRSRGALRMVDVMSRGLDCTGAALGSDAWTDRGGRYCAVKATAEVSAVLASAGEWATVGTWSRVSVDAWCDARDYIARVKALRREETRERAPRPANAAVMRAHRARKATTRPVGAVRLAESGKGVSAARARWDACTHEERGEVCAAFGLPAGSSWDTVRAHAVLSAGTTAASLADAMAVASVAGMAARVG